LAHPFLFTWTLVSLGCSLRRMQVFQEIAAGGAG
jgi:hypothetical protein